MSHAPAIAAALLAASAALFAPAAAAVPTTITYAGVLEDNGAPLNATVDVSFTIFSADSGGTVLYSEDDPGTVVLDGQLVVELGRNNLDDTVLDAPDLFLEVSVDGDALSPRVRLTSVPFALRAAKAQEAAVADALGGLAEADVVTQAQLITLHLDRGLVAGTGLTFTNGTISVASNGIGNSQLADNAVSLAKLAANSVDSSKIVDGSVALADLGTNSVDTNKIVNGTIVDADISTTANIAGSKLANSAVTAAKIGGGAVDQTKLARSKSLFVVSEPGCVESVGTLMTTNICTRDITSCGAGQCRDCNSNACGALNCGVTFCFNDAAGFIVGP